MDSAARVRMGWISRSEGHGVICEQRAKAGSQHPVYNIENPAFNEWPRFLEALTHWNFVTWRFSLTLFRLTPSLGTRLFIKYVWCDVHAKGREKGTRSIPKNVAYFLSCNIEGDEGKKKEEWGAMALSGAVTGRPRFSYLRSSNISKKKRHW